MRKIDGKYTIKTSQDGHRYVNIMQTFEAIVLPMQSSVNEMIDVVIGLKESIEKLELENAELKGFIKGIESPIRKPKKGEKNV